MKREDFDANEKVRLKQLTKSEDGTLFYPGEYEIDELPDVAFASSAVAKITVALPVSTGVAEVIPELVPEAIPEPIPKTTPPVIKPDSVKVSS